MKNKFKIIKNIEQNNFLEIELLNDNTLLIEILEKHDGGSIILNKEEVDALVNFLIKKPATNCNGFNN